MAHCMVVRLPLWAILWLQSCHCGPFYERKPTIVARFMVVAHLWLVGYHFGPIQGCKITNEMLFLVGMLTLRPVLWFVSYHYGPFYGWKASIV